MSSGVLSACFAFGFDAGKDMANEANQIWKSLHPGQGDFLFQNNVTYVIVLWGALTTNFIWCMILNAQNQIERPSLNFESQAYLPAVASWLNDG